MEYLEKDRKFLASFRVFNQDKLPHSLKVTIFAEYNAGYSGWITYTMETVNVGVLTPYQEKWFDGIVLDDTLGNGKIARCESEVYSID